MNNPGVQQKSSIFSSGVSCQMAVFIKVKCQVQSSKTLIAIFQSSFEHFEDSNPELKIAKQMPCSLGNLTESHPMKKMNIFIALQIRQCCWQPIDGYLRTFSPILNHYVCLMMKSGEKRQNQKRAVQPSAIFQSPKFFLS